MVRYHSLSNLIITNRGLLFTLKFWSLLSYFLDIKRKLSIAFYSLINSQITREYSIIEAYLWLFVYFKQDNWAHLLLIAELIYNNTKNDNIGYTSFKLNYKYYLYVSYKKDFDLQSKSRIAKEFSSKLEELMTMC